MCPPSATYKTESSHVARFVGSHRMVTAAGSSPALYQLSSPAAPSSGATHLCSHHTIQHSVTVQTTTTKLETSRILFLVELQTNHQ